MLRHIRSLLVPWNGEAKSRAQGPGRLTLLLLERVEKEMSERVELIAAGDGLVGRDRLMAG